MAQLLDKIRRAVETSGKTRYRIAKESGISAAQLSRLVNGQSGMTVETIERLADYLGFRIVIEPKGKSRKDR